MEQEQQITRGPILSFMRELVPDKRPTRERVVWTVRLTIIVAVVLFAVLLFLYAISRLFGIELMNLLKVLAVPITVGAAVPLLNWLQKKRELDVENQRARDEALQAYLDKMTELLVVHGLGKPQDDEHKLQGETVRIVAWARTKTALRRLDEGAHKGRVLRFLYEAGLLYKPAPVIDLDGADLRESDLRGSYLPKVCLQGADLRGVALRGAVLEEADLSAGYLLPHDKQDPERWSWHNREKIDPRENSFSAPGVRIADLSDTCLIGARLRNAYLGGADLSNAKLSNADLRGALLSEADLRGADLSGADLSGALKYATDGSMQLITNAELCQQARSLKSATMPDGQKYEDWLKSKSGGEENTNP